MKWLVGGAITILKNMKVNGKDYPIYEMENKNVWNHQPDGMFHMIDGIGLGSGHPECLGTQILDHKNM